MGVNRVRKGERRGRLSDKIGISSIHPPFSSTLLAKINLRSGIPPAQIKANLAATRIEG